MGLLFRALTGIRAESTPIDPWNPDDSRWWVSSMGAIWPGGATEAGQTVTADSARKHPAVVASIRLLAETIAGLPKILYEEMPDGTKRVAKESPFYRLIHDKPNAWQHSFDFHEDLMWDVLETGYARFLLVPGRTGGVEQLWPLATKDFKGVEVIPGGKRRYIYQPAGQDPRRILQDELMQVRGPRGYSLIQLGRESIALALAASQYAGRYFQNDGLPGGVLEHPGKLSPKAAANLKGAWNKIHRGSAKAHEMGVLEEGLKLHVIEADADKAQLNETREFQGEEFTGRIANIPPPMAGYLRRATFSNVEQQAIQFVVHTLMPWAKRLEMAYGFSVLPENLYVECLFDGLLRGDILSRYTALATAINARILTPNEARKIENKDPLDGGDELAPWPNSAADKTGVTPPQDAGGRKAAGGSPPGAEALRDLLWGHAPEGAAGPRRRTVTFERGAHGEILGGRILDEPEEPAAPAPVPEAPPRKRLSQRALSFQRDGNGKINGATVQPIGAA